MADQKQIVVIGAGPAGVQAALAAANAGCRVMLVSDEAPGGRATWETLLPSKLWLAARPGSMLADHQAAGGWLPQLAAMRARYERVAGSWQLQLREDLERAGVTYILGTASFLSPNVIRVSSPPGEDTLQIPADAIIIATGAVPFVPPGLEPDGQRVFAPHQIWQITTLPQSMVVIGSGGPATEYVDAFSRLGIQITWITGPVGVLSAFPPDAGRVISGVMLRRGVQIHTSMLAREIQRREDGVRVLTSDGAVYEAEKAFVAIGLRPDLERLNLPAASLKAGSSGALATDAYGHTAVPHIYLIGDAASPLSANISAAQGRIAGWDAAGLRVNPLQLEQVVMAIYTNPQVAMVGRMNDRSEALHKIRVPFSTSLRAHLWIESHGVGEGWLPDEAGFLEIAFDSTRRIVGALAVCPEAAEVVTPLAIAIRAGMAIGDLASVYPAHPTFSELGVLAARLVK